MITAGSLGSVGRDYNYHRNPRGSLFCAIRDIRSTNLKDSVDFRQSLSKEGYYSRFVYAVFHTSPSFFHFRRAPPLLLLLYPCFLNDLPNKRRMIANFSTDKINISPVSLFSSLSSLHALRPLSTSTSFYIRRCSLSHLSRVLSRSSVFPNKKHFYCFENWTSASKWGSA